MKIGIPKSLLYYYYYPFWKTLFTELGGEIVLSDNTSRNLLNSGIKQAISEICVPMKIYVGQIINLLDKKVDLIYIPRFVSIKKKITFCPKFLGLPDMIKNSINGIEGKILAHQVTSNSEDISDYSNYQEFIDKLDINKKELKKALTIARQEWLKFRRDQQQGFFIDDLLQNKREKYTPESNLTIGLLGYVYNIYDKFINMDLLSKLRQMGVKIVTFEMLSPDLIKKEIQQVDKPMFWQFTNFLLAAGNHFIKSEEIDGIIHFTAFGCGPDSVLGPFLEIDAKEKQKPFMTLRYDEQIGESHLLTRVEAFVDFLKKKNRKG